MHIVNPSRGPVKADNELFLSIKYRISLINIRINPTFEVRDQHYRRRHLSDAIFVWNFYHSTWELLQLTMLIEQGFQIKSEFHFNMRVSSPLMHLGVSMWAPQTDRDTGRVNSNTKSRSTRPTFHSRAETGSGPCSELAQCSWKI